MCRWGGLRLWPPKPGVQNSRRQGWGLLSGQAPGAKESPQLFLASLQPWMGPVSRRISPDCSLVDLALSSKLQQSDPSLLQGPETWAGGKGWCEQGMEETQAQVL